MLKKYPMPVVSSLMGLGCVPCDDKHFTGMVGMHGSYASNYAMNKSDLVFLLEDNEGNLLFNNFGFKIPCRVEFVHDMDMGFKTKVTNYGVNNLLIELYIVIDIKSYIMAPNSYKEFNNSYEIITASKVVMGKIPLYFGDTMEQSSAIVSS